MPREIIQPEESGTPARGLRRSLRSETRFALPARPGKGEIEAQTRQILRSLQAAGSTFPKNPWPAPSFRSRGWSTRIWRMEIEAIAIRE
jgi:hypothetical protein